MERLTAMRNGVTVYVGPGCEYDTGMISAELGSKHIRQVLTRLFAYEDTGLTPEEITGLCSMDRRAKMAELLRMEENKPLTLERLMEMDGEPVFLTPIQSACTDDKRGAWALVDLNQRMCRVSGGGLAVFENCGKTWMAYRYRPQE